MDTPQSKKENKSEKLDRIKNKVIQAKEREKGKEEDESTQQLTIRNSAWDSDNDNPSQTVSDPVGSEAREEEEDNRLVQ